MFDAEDELDVALHPDDVVRVGDLDVPAPEPVDFGEAPVPADPSRAFDPAFMPPPEFGPPVPPELASASIPKPADQPGPNEVWPPPVPSEAPGQVPPGGQPAPASAQSGSDIEADLADVESAKAESNEAERRKYEGELEDRANRLDYAENRRKELEQRAAQDLARQQSDAAADKKAQDHIAQTEAALRGFKFKDLWADKTAGQKIATVLGQALLALGAGMMKTPQYAMQILDKQRAEDHQKQMDNLALLKDDYVRARTGMQDAQLARQKIGAEIMLGRARKDELLAAQFEEASARAKDANSANDAAAYAAKLKRASAESKLAAHTTLRNLHLKDEENELTRKLKESQILANEARARLSDRGVGQGRKAGGGHGGGGGAGRGAAYDAFRDAVLKAPDANNIPDLGKLASAAGIKPNQIADQVTKIRTSKSKEDFGAGRAAWLGEKMANLQGSLEVIDENGSPLGKAPDAKTADRLRKQVQAFDQFKVRMTALRDYIKEHGDRAWGIDDAQQRDSLGAAAAAAGRVYNGLGATDASQRLEQMINGAIGTPGHGWWAGANLKVLNHVIDEANHQHQTRLNTSLRPGSPGAKPHAEGGHGGGLAKGHRKRQGGHVFEFQGGDEKDPNAWAMVQ